MTSEIRITVSGTLANSSGTGSAPLNRQFSHGTATIDQATKKRAGSSQALTSSWEAVVTGDVTSGYVFLLNTDATYNVDVGPLEAGSGGAGVLLATLKPGDPPMLFDKPATVTIMARASGGSSATATVDVEVWSA